MPAGYQGRAANGGRWQFLNVLRRKSPQRLGFGNVDRLVFTALYRVAPGVIGRTENSQAADGDPLAPRWCPRGARVASACAQEAAENEVRLTASLLELHRAAAITSASAYHLGGLWACRIHIREVQRRSPPRIVRITDRLASCPVSQFIPKPMVRKINTKAMPMRVKV